MKHIILSLLSIIVLGSCAGRELTIRTYTELAEDGRTLSREPNTALQTKENVTLAVEYIERYRLNRLAAESITPDGYRRAPVVSVFAFRIENEREEAVTPILTNVTLSDSNGDVFTNYSRDAFEEAFSRTLYYQDEFLFLFEDTENAAVLPTHISFRDGIFFDGTAVEPGATAYGFFVFDQSSTLANEVTLDVPFAANEDDESLVFTLRFSQAVVRKVIAR